MEAVIERTFAPLIKTLLTAIFEEENLSEDQFRVGLGCIVLENLVFKKEVFDIPEFPATLHRGSVGRFELQVPWGKLGKQPIVLVVDRLSLLFENREQWDANKFDKQEQSIKQAKLMTAQMFTGTNKATSDTFQGWQSFALGWVLKSLGRNLLESFQITVSNVHIRFEDAKSCPSRFSCGIAIGEFKSLDFKSNGTSNGDDDENVATDDVKLFQDYSLNLAAYWDPIDDDKYVHPSNIALVGRSASSIESLMQGLVGAKGNGAVGPTRCHHYLLSPTDMQIGVEATYNTKSTSLQVSLTFDLLVLPTNICVLMWVTCDS